LKGRGETVNKRGRQSGSKEILGRIKVSQDGKNVGVEDRTIEEEYDRKGRGDRRATVLILGHDPQGSDQPGKWATFSEGLGEKSRERNEEKRKTWGKTKGKHTFSEQVFGRAL